MNKELLIVSEVAEHLRVTVRTIRKGIKAGTISAVRVGGRVLVKKSTVDELIERGSAPGGRWRAIKENPFAVASG